jgi:hypothetical protein
MSEGDALELANLLAQRRTLAADSLAAKLRAQARVDVDQDETSEDIELERPELDTLAEALAEEPWAQAQEWFNHLRGEVAEARATTPPAS